MNNDAGVSCRGRGGGGMAGFSLLGGLQSTFGHTRPEDINPKARRRFTPAAPLPLSCSPALSRRVFEETPSPPPVIQSSRLNFGKPAKAPSHCHCCLSSVRDVWISFLPVTVMTPFPLIKGRRCQESDVNFPAKQYNYSEVTMRKREPRSRTIKKVAFLSVTEFLIIYLIRCQGCIFFWGGEWCVCGGGGGG